MTCERFREFDVEAFLVDSGSTEFDSFRMHLLDCATCAEALEEWTAFERGLADVMDTDGIGLNAHPEPERLEQFARVRAEMGDEAMAIEEHLNLCRSCQTELATLNQFETGFLPAVGVLTGATVGVAEQFDSVRPSPSFVEGLRERFESWSGGFGVAAPAFAVALLVVFGLWLSGALERFQSPSMSREITPQIVQESPRENRSAVPVAPNSPESGTPERLAVGVEEPELQERTSPKSPERGLEDLNAPIPAPVLTQDAREQLAEATINADAPTATPERGAPSAPELPKPNSAAPRQEILLAALTELPLPDYAAPASAGSVGWMRQFGAVRAGPAAVKIETRAPQGHAGLALKDAPRLWWNLSKDTDLSVEVTVVDDRELDPIAKIELKGPLRSGLHSVDLADHGVSLESGVEYRWFVSLIVDADRPSRNPVAAGALRVLGADDPRRAEVSQASPSERGHALARLGVWYDAYDFFASISASHPELGALARHREHLTKTAGAGG